MIDAGDGAQEAYEQLRRHMLSGSPATARSGLAVLLKEGMAAWIEHGAGAAALSLSVPNRTASPILMPPLEAGIVQILASIALSRIQEMHS